MFKDSHDQTEYIRQNYPEVTDQRIDEDHWDLYCPTCKIVRGFQVIERSEGRVYSQRYGRQDEYQIDSEAPQAIFFRCPVCKTYKQWIVYVLGSTDEEVAQQKRARHVHRVASLPNEGIEDIEELPAEPPSLQ